MPQAVEGLELRPGTDADISAVIELMRSALGEGKIPRTREFFLWKHRENPFGASPMWVAEKDGRLVGARLFLRWKWQCGAGSANAVRAVDTSTHPDFQGAGIFKRLTLGLAEEMKTQGVGFVYNTPNEKSRPGYIKMGWVAAGRVPLWFRPRHPLRAALKLLERRNGSQDEDAEFKDGANSESLERLLVALGPTWIHHSTAHRYRTPVDTTYLRWRYQRCPAFRYDAASVDPRAFVIYRERMRAGLSELTLCDLFFERTPAGARSALAALRQALQRTSADYAAIALHPDPAEAALLTLAGFLPAPNTGPILTIRELAGWQSLPDPRRLRNWQASIGDLELF